ncbi:hypothetical protein [Rhizobium leguminosarum]|nr:hypothetical protein [Rhizobium leguminosarum]
MRFIVGHSSCFAEGTTVTVASRREPGQRQRRDDQAASPARV